MKSKAFTLLELLIVVAIIAILAAIAIPNFLEAQTRAKVARAKTDIRTASMALEAYAVDYGDYPYPSWVFSGDMGPDLNGFIYRVVELTTPIAYLSSVDLPDPFKPSWKEFSDASYMSAIPWPPTYMYFNYSGWYLTTLPTEVRQDAVPFQGYCLSSVGPNRIFDGANFIPLILENPNFKPKLLSLLLRDVYDPTNGTTSVGDIVRWTGKPQKIGTF